MVVLLLPLCGINVHAHDIEAKNADGVTIYYRWINDRTELAVTYRGDDWLDGRHCYSGIVVIPESVKYGGNTYSVTCIGSGHFFGIELTSVTIPNSVTTIGSSAFMDCDNLTSIVSEIKNPFIISGVGFSSYAYATLTVPAGTKSLYQSTTGWSEFQNIVEASGGGH